MSFFLAAEKDGEEEEEEEKKMDTENDDIFGNDDDDDDAYKESEDGSECKERNKENAMSMEVEKDDEENVNKYEAVYINNYKLPHQTYCDNVMSGVIALLREDGVTSAVFKIRGHPLFETIQDCRSKHAYKLQNASSTCPWYGLPWKEEMARTKNKINKQSKSSMVSL